MYKQASNVRQKNRLTDLCKLRFPPCAITWYGTKCTRVAANLPSYAVISKCLQAGFILRHSLRISSQPSNPASCFHWTAWLLKFRNHWLMAFAAWTVTTSSKCTWSWAVPVAWSQAIFRGSSRFCLFFSRSASQPSRPARYLILCPSPTLCGDNRSCIRSNGGPTKNKTRPELSCWKPCRIWECSASFILSGSVYTSGGLGGL